MKIRGKKIDGPNEELIVLPRGDDQIVLKARAVLSFDDFENLCPSPVPPVRTLSGGEQQNNVSDPKYVADLDEYGKKRLAWMVIKSLNVPENEIEWDTVKDDDPDTWEGYNHEMLECGFSEMEVGRVIQGVMVANSLSDEHIEQAKERFLASQQAAAAAAQSQKDGPATT